MAASQHEELKTFFQALSGENARPLDPDHPFYVPVLEATPEKDPILDLIARIEWASSESVNLLTGFRGNGKSTQLRRLKKSLEEAGCRVVLVDMLDYVLMSKPVELSDFLLSLMAAFAEAIRGESGFEPLAERYFTRVGNFLKSEVRIEGLEVGVEGMGLSAGLGLKLKTDPSFKALIQERLRGHYTRLVRDARAFVVEVVNTIRHRSGKPDRKVVLLVDSMEQVRGWGKEAVDVQNSVVETFSGQASNLAFPQIHVVYTIPPFVIPLAHNVGRDFGGNPIASWPNVHVRDREGHSDPAGLGVMERIVAKRYARWREVFTAEQLHRLARCAGGDVRDYFRLVRECLISLRNSRERRVTDDMLSFVEQQLRAELTPIARKDALWLARIHERKDTALEDVSELPTLARFLDSNLIMNYQNGQPWYDVHPLILRDVLAVGGGYEE